LKHDHLISEANYCCPVLFNWALTGARSALTGKRQTKSKVLFFGFAATSQSRNPELTNPAHILPQQFHHLSGDEMCASFNWVSPSA
jgi:hypothetical protein